MLCFIIKIKRRVAGNAPFSDDLETAHEICYMIVYVSFVYNYIIKFVN